MFTLVPVNFFDPATAREALGRVAALSPDSVAAYRELPQYGAVLVYEDRGEGAPAIFELLGKLGSCPEYNKVLCYWSGGKVGIGVAQGRSLLLANEYDAPDFATAQYFIFLALKSLQLNPEVTSIRFMHPLSGEQEMALYRYFKAVDYDARA